MLWKCSNQWSFSYRLTDTFCSKCNPLWNRQKTEWGYMDAPRFRCLSRFFRLPIQCMGYLWLCQNGSLISFRGIFLGTGESDFSFVSLSVCQHGKSTYKLISFTRGTTFSHCLGIPQLNLGPAHGKWKILFQFLKRVWPVPPALGIRFKLCAK